MHEPQGKHISTSQPHMFICYVTPSALLKTYQNLSVSVLALYMKMRTVYDFYSDVSMTLHLTAHCNVVVLILELVFIGVRTCAIVTVELRNSYNCKLVSTVL